MDQNCNYNKAESYYLGFLVWPRGRIYGFLPRSYLLLVEFRFSTVAMSPPLVRSLGCMALHAYRGRGELCSGRPRSGHRVFPRLITGRRTGLAVIWIPIIGLVRRRIAVTRLWGPRVALPGLVRLLGAPIHFPANSTCGASQ